MTSSSHLTNSLATEAVLSGVDYFLYKEPFDVKILRVSAASDYFASFISQMISSTIIPSTITPATLDNISSGILYAGVNYVLKYDQRGLFMIFLMQAGSSYVADMVLSSYSKV
jgi:hypothetical protein